LRKTVLKLRLMTSDPLLVVRSVTTVTRRDISLEIAPKLRQPTGSRLLARKPATRVTRKGIYRDIALKAQVQRRRLATIAMKTDILQKIALMRLLKVWRVDQKDATIAIKRVISQGIAQKQIVL